MEGRTAQKAKGYAVFVVIVGGLSLSAARAATYFSANGGLDVNNIIAKLGLMTADVTANPLGIDFTLPGVIETFAACIAIPVFVAFATSLKGQKLDNEDTGREHGDDRLATEREMMSLRDKKYFCNNVLYSRRTYLAMLPHDKRTKAILDGRNLNCITLGISGLGKTYNLVWPDLMQSVGDCLEPLPYGIRNIPEHLSRSKAAKTARWLLGLAGLKKTAEAKEEPPAAAEPEEKARKPRKEKTAREKSELRKSWEENVGSSSRKEEREKAKTRVTAGYDVFCTDPKGDNVRDVGMLYERAGYKIKVVDTRDFRKGLHVNPLAYIKANTVDVKPAQDIKVGVNVCGPASLDEKDMTVEREIEDGLENGETKQLQHTSEDLFYARASLNLVTEETGFSDIPEPTMSLTEIVQAIEDADPGSEEQRMLEKQRDMLYIRYEAGGHKTPVREDGTYGDVKGNGCQKVADTLASFRYKRTSGTITVEYKNLAPRATSAVVEIELDEALVADRLLVKTRGEIEYPTDDNGNPVSTGTLKWKLGHVPGKKRRRANGKNASAEEDMMTSEKLVLHVHVAAATVPDGIDLTKTVDCLVANLKGTDAQSNGSEDPFWEDTKRLCFMSIIAFLFEKYGPECRTLPEMMRLLNMALAKSGNPEDLSPLAIMMQEWETGESAKPIETVNETEDGFKTITKTYKKTGEVPRRRDDSIALHCFYAFTSGAPETVQSVVISCQACLVNLITNEAKEFLAYDELELDTLGDPGQKQVIFCVTEDTNSPYDFLTALIVYQAINLAQDRAYKKYGGRLPRHVRFVLDEAANIGKIPILVRALAVVRSRNISISMYLQSKAQLALVYGEKEADVIFDNCSTIVFLGAQTEETLEEMSKKVGTETVQTRTFQRSFQSSSLMAASTSENLTSNERRVMSASQVSRMEKGWLLLFIFNSRAIFDHKFETRKHPYYAYINPGDKREWLEPLARCDKRFDYREYLERRGYKR